MTGIPIGQLFLDHDIPRFRIHYRSRNQTESSTMVIVAKTSDDAKQFLIDWHKNDGRQIVIIRSEKMDGII